MKDTISKSDWLTAEKCVAMSWYGLRAAPSPPPESELFRMKQGQEIGSFARHLYPEGHLIPQAIGQSSAEITSALLTDPATQVLFEATADSGPFVAKADIIERQNRGWHILEVKSSFSDTEKIKDLIDDLAYTVFVFQLSGVLVVKASLLLLSRSYRYGDGPAKLFEVVDQTEKVLARSVEFNLAAKACTAELFSSAPPPAKLVSTCRECDAFSTQCLGVGIEHSVLEIPKLHYKKLTRLSDAGIVNLASLPGDLGLNEIQQRAVNSATSGTLIVEKGLNGALQSITWPCHYLDFETVATVMPLYPGHGCHEQILTQFSIHHRDGIDAQPSHSEYLADAFKDCQRELAEALIAALAPQGSILVYSSFERTRITALQKLFPDLAGSLQAILERLVDLLPLISGYVYHPDFRGSFSIKQVLPVLVPDLSYQELAIRDGDMAITRFAQMARGEIPAKEIALTRLQLLHYCKLDTLAMVRLHEILLKLAAG